MQTVTRQGRTSSASELLIDAGLVLASSLDLRTTMARVAALLVPDLADLCAIDLLEDDGSIGEVAVAAREPRIAVSLERLRACHPLDPAGAHPVARVIATGEPMLLESMDEAQLSSYAQGATHERFMLRHDYRAAVVAPLLARGRTLGALSVLRLGEGACYGPDELDLAGELARRAALAIDNARLYRASQHLERRLDAILENLAEAVIVENSEGRLVYANDAAAKLVLAASRREVVELPRSTIAARFLILDEQGRELTAADIPARSVFRGQEPRPLLVRNVVRATGEERWLNVRSSGISNPETGEVDLAVNVYENITDVKRAQLAESFMAQASRVLSSSMDYEETLQRVARLAVPQIADWCSIDLVDEHGNIRNVAVHHSDPRMVELAQSALARYPRAPGDPAGVPEVIRGGVPRLYTDITREALAAYAADEEQLSMLTAIGATAVAIVPLASSVRTLGAVTFVTAESHRRMTPLDVDLAVRLGRRAGTAVENARLYTERTRIARALERALLPESLPKVPGAEVASLYRAAGELNEVGGDFYDVFEHPDGRWMLVIGDVVGKGARAAGVTALARHTLRAAAMAGQGPTEMLTTLHLALTRQPAGADMCTACLAALEIGGGGARATIALAGHPPPLLVDELGARPIGAIGTVLGVIDPVEVREVRATLSGGQTLLLYTDGVLDAGRPAEPLGERGLHEACSETVGAPAREMLELIERRALERAAHGLRDDLAMLALRLAAPSAGRRP